MCNFVCIVNKVNLRKQEGSPLPHILCEVPSLVNCHWGDIKSGDLCPPLNLTLTNYGLVVLSSVPYPLPTFLPHTDYRFVCNPSVGQFERVFCNIHMIPLVVPCWQSARCAEFRVFLVVLSVRGWTSKRHNTARVSLARTGYGRGS